MRRCRHRRCNGAATPDFHPLDRTSFAWRTHSITSSAMASSVGGMSRPSALAVLRLIYSLYFVGACPGSWDGSLPTRLNDILSAARDTEARGDC
jgi:hypothetical protein